MNDNLAYIMVIAAVGMVLWITVATAGCDINSNKVRRLRRQAVELNHAKWVVTDAHGTVEWVWITNRTEVGK